LSLLLFFLSWKIKFGIVRHSELGSSSTYAYPIFLTMITFFPGLIGILCALTSTTMADSKEQVPFSSDNQNSDLVRQGNLPSLADLLTLETRASIFYSYARETDISERFSNGGDSLTMFVPTNKAIMALARKPYVSC
jgi:hypothetical protein